MYWGKSFTNGDMSSAKNLGYDCSRGPKTYACLQAQIMGSHSTHQHDGGQEVCNFSVGRSCSKRPASRPSSETQYKQLTGTQTPDARPSWYGSL